MVIYTDVDNPLDIVACGEQHRIPSLSTDTVAVSVEFAAVARVAGVDRHDDRKRRAAPRTSPLTILARRSRSCNCERISAELHRQEATEHDVQGAYTAPVVRPSAHTLLCAEGSFAVDGERIDLGYALCI